MPDHLLKARHLTIERWLGRRWVTIVDDLDLTLDAGEMLGLVGESGSGKSTLLQAFAGLLPRATTRIRGRVRFGQHELLKLDEAHWRRLRGRQLCWLPQNPMNAFNPVARVGRQLGALLAARASLSRRQARRALIDAMHQLELADDAALLQRYPQALSGGQRQRLLMALVLALQPRLLLADEPTSALDPSSRSALLASLRRACQERGIGILTVSHDLALIAGHCERLAVMYCGQIVEAGPVLDVYRAPAHPYTAALLAAHPGNRPRQGEPTRLPAIPGQPPAIGHWPDACRFASRCAHSQTRCHTQASDWRPARSPHGWRCHYPLTDETQAD